MSLRRLAEYGPDELQAARRISALHILLEQFKNVLIMILLAGTAVSALLGRGLEAIVITGIVIFAVLLGFMQEYRAERAIEALRQMTVSESVILQGDEAVLTGESVPSKAHRPPIPCSSFPASWSKAFQNSPVLAPRLL